MSRTLVAALFAAALAACEGARESAPPEPRPPNLVLVVVDALRADHLGAYGGTGAATPHLDRFAAGAALFEQARTLAPCTFPSVNALLTGRHPVRFLDQPFGHLGIPAPVATLPEALRRAGYRTAAVSASPVVRASPSAINRAGGFGRGFDLFLEGCTWQDGRCVTRRAADLLALLPEPFFLYVHYLDPHDPYASPMAPEPAASGLPPWVLAGDPLPAARRLYGGGEGGGGVAA
ncbi:MAG TPA: sulfatase-like hydrolase/transferase, partial [Thermoanaerobaculia bacterium]|nr:sulfatase-like hydrolase/transferase [Thermoanaerobaculia bacterium]